MAIRHLGSDSLVTTARDHVDPVRLMFMREWVPSPTLPLWFCPPLLFRCRCLCAGPHESSADDWATVGVEIFNRHNRTVRICRILCHQETLRIAGRTNGGVHQVGMKCRVAASARCFRSRSAGVTIVDRVRTDLDRHGITGRKVLHGDNDLLIVVVAVVGTRFDRNRWRVEFEARRQVCTSLNRLDVALGSTRACCLANFRLVAY